MNDGRAIRLFSFWTAEKSGKAALSGRPTGWVLPNIINNNSPQQRRAIFYRRWKSAQPLNRLRYILCSQKLCRVSKPKTKTKIEEKEGGTNSTQELLRGSCAEEFQRRAPNKIMNQQRDMAVLNQVDRDGHSFTPDIYPQLAHSLREKKIKSIHSFFDGCDFYRGTKNKREKNHQNESKFDWLSSSYVALSFSRMSLLSSASLFFFFLLHHRGNR